MIDANCGKSAHRCARTTNIHNDRLHAGAYVPAHGTGHTSLHRHNRRRHREGGPPIMCVAASPEHRPYRARPSKRPQLRSFKFATRPSRRTRPRKVALPRWAALLQKVASSQDARPRQQLPMSRVTPPKRDVPPVGAARPGAATDGNEPPTDKFRWLSRPAVWGQPESLHCLR